MKKLIFAMALLTMTVVAGCGQSSEPKAENKMTEDQLFEKKKECSGLRTKIEELLTEESKQNYFQEVFYSPTNNSCFYRYDVLMDGERKVIIKDFFTNKMVFEMFLDTTPINKNEINIYEETKLKIKNKVKELKGE